MNTCRPDINAGRERESESKMGLHVTEYTMTDSAENYSNNERM